MDSNGIMVFIWFLLDQRFCYGTEEAEGLSESHGTFARTDMITNEACMIWGAGVDAQEADMDAGLDAGR